MIIIFFILCVTFCLLPNEISKLVNQVSEHRRRALQMEMLTLHWVGPGSAQDRAVFPLTPCIFFLKLEAKRLYIKIIQTTNVRICKVLFA